jgi:hypothetical protein
MFHNFLNPIYIVDIGDLIRMLDYKGKTLLKPQKLSVEIHGESGSIIVKNLDSNTDTYMNFAVVGRSGLTITPFLFCHNNEEVKIIINKNVNGIKIYFHSI